MTSKRRFLQNTGAFTPGGLVPWGYSGYSARDFKAMVKEMGLKYFFVEQDMAPDSIANIITSYTNLKKMLAW